MKVLCTVLYTFPMVLRRRIFFLTIKSLLSLWSFPIFTSTSVLWKFSVLFSIHSLWYLAGEFCLTIKSLLSLWSFAIFTSTSVLWKFSVLFSIHSLWYLEGEFFFWQSRACWVCDHFLYSPQHQYYESSLYCSLYIPYGT